jgi:predicted nucleic acid-binding protein
VNRRYWDANAFLGWLRAEPDKADACRAVIGEAQAGRVLIVTSTLTLAEVLWLKGKDPIPEADRDAIRAFFRHEWIALVQLDRAVGEFAQEVVWKNGIRPKDAVHVASALRSDVVSLDTFDGPLQAKAGELGIRVGAPEVPGQLFAPPLDG